MSILRTWNSFDAAKEAESSALVSTSTTRCLWSAQPWSQLQTHGLWMDVE